MNLKQDGFIERIRPERSVSAEVMRRVAYTLAKVFFPFLIIISPPKV